MPVENRFERVFSPENLLGISDFVKFTYSVTLLNIFLESSKLIFPSELKEYFLITSLILSMSICVVTFLYMRDYAIKLSTIDIITLLLIGWITLLSSTLSIQTLKLQMIITSLLSLLLFSQYFRRYSNQLNFVAVVILCTGILEALLGCLQLYGVIVTNYFFKIVGSFSNPGPFAIYVSSTGVFSLGLYLHTNSKLVKNTAFVGILFCILILPATNSRAAWISSVISCVYLLVKKNRPSFRSLIQFLIPVSIVLSIFFFALLKYKEPSANGRILIWKVSLDMIKEEPFGIGIGNFKNKYPFYQADYFSRKTYDPTDKEVQLSDNIEFAFNDPLQFGIETGVVGILLGLTFILLLLFCPINDDCNAQAARGAVISIIVASLFSYPLQIAPIWWLFVTYSLFICVQFPTLVIEIPKVRYLKILTTCLFTIFACYMLSWAWNDLRAKRSWYSAQFSFKNGLIKSAEKQYSELVRTIDYNKDPLLDYGKVLYKMGYVSKATEVLSFASKFIGDPFLFCNLGDAYVALKKPSEAENAYKMAINMNPNRLYPRYLLTLLYHRNNRIHEADSLARYIIKMPIKVESSATNEMIYEMKKLISK